jgi:predicted permease
MNIKQEGIFALRHIRGKPVLYLNVIGLFAIGFGISVGSFGLLHYILTEALPYQNSSALVLLHDVFPKRGKELLGISEPELSDYRGKTRSFTDLAVIESGKTTILLPEPRRLTSAAVSANLFSLLGVNPMKGRTFSSGDEIYASAPVAIVSARLLKQLPGCTILADCRVASATTTYSVIGVLPQTFRLPSDLESSEQTDLLTPFQTIPSQLGTLQNRHNPRLLVIGRLRSAVSLAQAQHEMSIVAQRLQEQYASVYESDGLLIQIQELRAAVLGDASFALLMATVGASLLFLVALVNAGTLLLLVNSKRIHTLVTTLALGAPLISLRIQLLFEASILSLAAFIPGSLIGWFIFVFVARLSAGKHLPLLRDAHPSISTAVFGVILGALGMAVIFAISQSSISRAKKLIPSINREGRAMTSSRSGVRNQSISLMLQIGLSTVLISFFLLVALSQFRLRSADLGFKTKDILVSQVELPSNKMKSNESTLSFFDTVLLDVRSQDGLQQSCLSMSPPLVQVNEKFPFETAETVGKISAQSFSVDIVSGGCLGVLRIPLLEGADLPIHKASTTEPQALVSQSFAHQMWPSGFAVGKLIRANLQKNSPWITIVGVVSDVHHEGPNGESSPTVYLHYADIPALTTSSVRFMRLLSRTERPRRDAYQVIQKAVSAVDPAIPAEPLGSLADLLAQTTAPWAFTGQLLSITSVLGPVIAITGLYSLLSALILLRRKEIAIRIAVGASASGIFDLLSKQISLRVLAGGVTGACASVLIFSKVKLYLPQTALSEAFTAGTCAVLALLFIGLLAAASLVPLAMSQANSAYREG